MRQEESKKGLSGSAGLDCSRAGEFDEDWRVYFRKKMAYHTRRDRYPNEMMLKPVLV